MTARSGTREPSLGALIDNLRAGDRWVRLHAAALLGQRGREAPGAVAALVEALQDGDFHVRKVAALALGEIGAGALSAVPALVAALGDGEASVRRRAAVALGEIGATAAVAPLRQARQDADETVGAAVLIALKQLRGRGTGAAAA